MKIFAYLIKYGKNLSFFLMSIYSCLILGEAGIYFSFSFARDAHIPVQGFEVYTESMFTLVFAILLLLAMYTCFLIFNSAQNKKRTIPIFLFFLSIVLCIAIVQKGTNFHVDIQAMDNNANRYFLCLLLSLGSFILFSLAYRVVSNALFRELFSKNFQDKCTLALNRDRSRIYPRWFRKWLNFLNKHLKSNKVIYVLTDTRQGTLINQMINKDNFVEEPILFEEIVPKVTTHFKRTPTQFTFIEIEPIDNRIKERVSVRTE